MEKEYTILLCEDETFVARSYIRKLELEGFKVVHVNNGKDGIEFMTKNPPDLVILDLMMPVKSGFEVLQEIQKNDNDTLKQIPVIVASNLGQQSDIDEATKLGAKDFLVKSNISLKELVNKVKTHLPQ